MKKLFTAGVIICIALIVFGTIFALTGIYGRNFLAGFLAKSAASSPADLNQTNTTNHIPIATEASYPVKVGSAKVNAGDITAVGSLDK